MSRDKVQVNSTWSDVGLLVLRLGVGGALAAHGAQKLFGWFGGYGPSGTGQFMDSMGFAGNGKRNAVLAGLGEFGGGSLLALGLATGPAGAAATGTMAVAASTHVPNGFFNADGGYELPATFALVSTALALAGPGRFSIDHLTGHPLNRKWMAFTGLATTLGSAAYLIATRTKPEPADEEVQATEAAADDSSVAESDSAG
jgi:putative oxidoreductase